MMFETIAVYSGLIATLWIFIGVYVASLFYEGYSHCKQFCSELGATGSPTEKLSPLMVVLVFNCCVINLSAVAMVYSHNMVV